MSTITKSSTRTLADVVAVRRRFSRSVHLERDWEARTEQPRATSGYHLTPSAYELLKIIAGAWERSSDRALTVVGPYGAGKSAFCVFLSGLVSGGKDECQILRERDVTLAKTLSSPKRRLLPIPVVGSREPLARALVKGLLHALETEDAALVSGLRPKFNNVLDSPAPAPREVANLYVIAAELVANSGYSGLLLMADELGKFLEYAALHPKGGDIFTLQELAEAAARSTAPLFVVAVLHQNADAYAQKLGRAHQAEWAKVGERFREVPFFPSDTERMDMVGYAIEHSTGLHLNGSFGKLAAQGALRLPSSVGERFPDMARAAYPLHPLVLMALPALFRKTGQSHRSLFNFLSGEEAHALGRFIRENTYTPDAPPLFMLDSLFDYTAEVLLGGWSAGTLARLWAEAVDAVDRALRVSDTARRVLKSIALLGLLRDPHLPADKKTLVWALTEADGNSPDVGAALDELLERRLIAWSRTRELYRLWEGGDVDVESALETARSGLPSGTTLRAATDRGLCPLPRLIARRYSYETGTLRTVETRPCAVGELAKTLKVQEGLSVVLCLAENADEAERAEAIVRAQGRTNVLAAIVRETEILREAALDVAAVGEVAAHTPALQSDRAARRELAARRFEAESAFRDEWSRLFGPASALPRWFHNGAPVTFETGRDFSTFLSKMAYDTYPATPILRNELINRRALSSAAAAGRRALIEVMLTNPDKPRLGIKGFPPEFSMYECLLRTTGLHREISPGVWAFVSPQNDTAKLGEVWRVLEAEIFVDPPAPCPVADLWSKLAAPPFGLSEGVMPPLLCAFLLAHAHETTLYRDGTYLAEPGVADWEILLRRPELFAVAGSRIEGERVLVVQRLARGLGVEPFAVPVAQALVRNMRRLPEHARRTAKLPEEAKALRRSLESVASPEKLLFHDLPQALGVAGLFSGGEAGKLDVEAFFTHLNRALQAWYMATPNMIAQARDTLLEACSMPTGPGGWAQLRRECAALEGRVAEPELIPFVDRAGAPGDDASVLESVLALVANRPPRTWTDTEEERFPPQARVFGEMFQQAQRREAKVKPKRGVPAPAQSTLMAEISILSEADTERSIKLAEDLFAELNKKKRAAPRHVQIAALSALLRMLEDEDRGTS
jgi:hypothetical protein